MDNCPNCSHPQHEGRCEVVCVGGDVCECGKPKGIDWSKVPEVIQPNEINWSRFIEGTDWDE